MNKLTTVFSSFFRNRLNVFYVLAFAPLLLILYFHVSWPFSVVIPIYSFILLLIKKDNLSLRRNAGSLQKAFGLLILLGSFFAYYALVLFFNSPSFYGSANYALYIFGLFLAFFNINALRDAFTPIFLIVAATSSSFMSEWLKPFLTPYIPHFVSFIAAIIRAFGIRVTTDGQAIVLYTLKGPLDLLFVWGCVGVSSTLIFSIILVIVLFEEPASLRTKMLWSIFGILGALVVNVIRVTIIFLADYFYGSEVGGNVHYILGYALFISWLAFFFYIFSKRQVMSGKIRSIKEKLF